MTKLEVLQALQDITDKLDPEVDDEGAMGLAIFEAADKIQKQVQLMNKEQFELLISIAQQWVETYDDPDTFPESEYPELWKQLDSVRKIITGA